MLHIERLFSLSVLVITLVFFLVSFQYEMFLSGNSGVGEAFLPRIISLTLLLLISFYTYSLFRTKMSNNNQKKKRFIQSVAAKQVFMVLGLLTCLILIDFIGMISTLVLFLIGALHFIEKVSLSKSIIISVLTLTSLYLIFVKWLNIILPSGVLL